MGEEKTFGSPHCLRGIKQYLTSAKRTLKNTRTYFTYACVCVCVNMEGPGQWMTFTKHRRKISLMTT